MSGKITKAEFQKWAEQFRKMTIEFLEQDTFTEKQKEGLAEATALFAFYTSQECLMAVTNGLVMFELLTFQKEVPWPVLDNATFSEWDRQVGQRVVEHCIAEGYYNPSNPPNLTLLKQRGQKVEAKTKDENYLSRMLNYADSEDYKTINTQVSFLKQVRKMNGKDLYEGEGEIPAGATFIEEDFIGRAEKLIAKVEAEKNSPQTPPPSNPNYQNNLGNEITDLQNQVRQLEDKIKDNSTATNPAEKETYQKLLEDIKKRLGDKEKELQKIKKQETHDKPNNNLPLIIGVSAAAIIFLLIIIIVLLARRRD